MVTTIVVPSTFFSSNLFGMCPHANPLAVAFLGVRNCRHRFPVIWWGIWNTPRNMCVSYQRCVWLAAKATCPQGQKVYINVQVHLSNLRDSGFCSALLLIFLWCCHLEAPLCRSSEMAPHQWLVHRIQRKQELGGIHPHSSSFDQTAWLHWSDRRCRGPQSVFWGQKVVSDILKHRKLLPLSSIFWFSDQGTPCSVYLSAVPPGLESWPIFCCGGFGFPPPPVAKIWPIFCYDSFGFPPPHVAKIWPIFCYGGFGFPPLPVAKISSIVCYDGFGCPPSPDAENTCVSILFVLLGCYLAIRLVWKVSILRHAYCTAIPVFFGVLLHLIWRTLPFHFLSCFGFIWQFAWNGR